MSEQQKPTRYFAVLPAAGTGQRMGGTQPKQYLPVQGKTLLEHACAALCQHPQIERVGIVVAADDTYVNQLVWPTKVEILRVGGATRHASVLNGLLAWQNLCGSNDWVLVHDAARPGLSTELLTRLIDQVADHPVGGLLALPLADTLKRADALGVQVLQTLAREGLWQAQTPQMFRYGLLRDALQDAITAQRAVTDEASALEAVGYQPRLVQGSMRNFKVTYPDDLPIVERFLR